MSVFESIERFPVEYTPTGDKALLMAWYTLNDPENPERHVVAVVLCLEDGRPAIATTSDFKFDYRYDLANDRWVDGSRTLAQTGDSNADADQEDADDGSAEVPR